MWWSSIYLRSIYGSIAEILCFYTIVRAGETVTATGLWGVLIIQ
jgi:hypothetical protein